MRSHVCRALGAIVLSLGSFGTAAQALSFRGTAWLSRRHPSDHVAICCV
jgi:hypothetical protein